jgi:hypothetical protein
VLENKHRYNMELLVEVNATCPHCGEVFPLQIDTSQSEQSFIEDLVNPLGLARLRRLAPAASVVDLVCEA